MFPQNDILNQMRRRRALEPPFATPPIALDQEAEQSKSDPWSERLPDGRTVNEAIMGTLRQKQAAPFPAPPKPKLYDDGDPGTGFDYSTPGTEPLPTSTGTETRPWKVGGSLEKDPLKREAARIRAMIENPTSEVSQTGAVDTPKPMGRLKASLLGALFGLAQGDRNTSLAERLAAGGTGAVIGGVKPRAVQDWRRRMEVDDAQGQLAQQTKLSAGQAQLENLRAETQSRMADLTIDPETGQVVKRQPRRAPQYIERSDGVYEVSEASPNGRRIGNIPGEVKARSRGSVHYENREDGVYAIYEDADGSIKSQRVEGVPGKPSEREDKTVANRAKREAKLKEASDYDSEANAVDAQANSLNEHIKKLEEGMAAIPQFATSTTVVDAEGNPSQVSNPARDDHMKALADLKRQQQDLRNKATQLRGDARKAKADAESIPETTGQAKQSGRRWSASKWAAANPGGDVSAAREAARAANYQVIE
jgi:hypothetical protein